jgi:hypothetical protein
MSNAHDLIKAIIDEDFISAKEITNNLVFAAVSNELEVAKMEVASALFPTEDAVDEAVTAKRIRILRKSHRTGKPVTGGTKDWMNRSYSRKLHKLKSKEKGLGEGKMSAKDFDQDGKIETAQKETFGSRINAAVKSGNLSPRAAHRTKNQGKY